MELSARALAQYRSIMDRIDRLRADIDRQTRKEKRRRVRRRLAKYVEPRVPTPRTREDWLDQIYGRRT